MVLELENSIQRMLLEVKNCIYHHHLHRLSPRRYQSRLAEFQGLLWVQTMSKLKLKLLEPHLVGINTISHLFLKTEFTFSLELKVHVFATGHCLTHSKKPPLGYSSSSIRGSIQSPQSSLLSLSAATDKSTIPLSSLSTTSTNHVNLVATGSTFKTPPKFTTTNKIELEYSNYPTCLLSMSNSSSCTSPSSSIDGCPLESLSSSVNQEPSNSIASFDTTFREVLYDSDIFQASGMETHQPDEPHVGYKSQVKSPSKITRPSGLRRPSPKIGFFDAVSFYLFLL